MPGEVTALLCTLCYSLSYVVLHKGQKTSKTDDNGLFAVLLVASVLLASAWLLKHGIPASPATLIHSNLARAYGYCALSGVVATLLGRLALYGSVARVGATRGVVIHAVAALITLALAVVVLGEKLDSEHLIGMPLLLIGVCLLLLERRLIPTRSILSRIFHYGVYLGLAAVALQGVGHLARKLAMMYPIRPLDAATIDICAALIVYIIVLTVTGRLWRYIRTYFTEGNGYIWAAGMLSAAGVLLFFVALGTAPVSNVAMIVGLQPVVVAILSATLFRGLEQFTWMTAIYILLVVAGGGLMVAA